MRNFVVSVLLSEDDLQNLGLQNVTSDQYRKICNTVQQIITEQHFNDALKQACKQVLGWEEFAPKSDTELVEGRRKKAYALFEIHEGLPPIDGLGGWEYNGVDTYKLTVFWTNPLGGDSVKGYFKVIFEPRSDIAKAIYHG
jgi:hypothetical protein